MSTLKNVIASFLFLSLIAGSASAQNGRTATDKRQAVLTIQVNVVPVVGLLKQGARIQDNQPVSYSIPVAPVRYSVTEKMRDEVIRGASQQVVVKTVVAE